MNSAPQKDIITRLADAGEDAINRLADLPGGRFTSFDDSPADDGAAEAASLAAQEA